MQPWLSQTAVSPGCNSSGTLIRLPTSSFLGLEAPGSPSPAISLPPSTAEHPRFLAQNEPFRLGGQMHFYICLEKKIVGALLAVKRGF